MKPWRDLIGLYVLVRLTYLTTLVYKRRVQDVSPSGEYVKFEGLEHWCKADELVLEEVLE